MEQSHISSSQNQFQPKKLHYLMILENMLGQNRNHQSIKGQIRRKTKRVEGLTYSVLVESQQKYLQKIGLSDHDADLFNYIGRIMNDRQRSFLSSINTGLTNIKLNYKAPPQPQPQPCPQIVQQVQNVLNNIDLPLSLFKRNDNYWSIDNPKTKEANEYLRRLKQQDIKFKNQVQKKRQQIIEEKQKVRNRTIDAVRSQDQSHKRQLQQKINRKIEQLKKNSEQRQKAISQSVQFIKERGKPLFRKIEKQFKEKAQISSLEQKKRRLSQLRQVMRSVPIEQIESHRQRYEKQKSERQNRTILNEPLNVSFKSHFYQEIKTLGVSRFTQMQPNSSLFQKKLEYSQMVKQNHKPAIDESKKEQMQSRIKLMNKRRARVVKSKKQTVDSDEEDEDEQQSEEQEQQEQEQPSQSLDEDSDGPQPTKDDQYQPTNKERYKMGINYLQEARKLAAKKTKQSARTKRINTATEDQTIDFELTRGNKQGLETVEPKGKRERFVWVSKYDQEQKKQQRILYKNYLKEVQKDSSSGLMDTSQIKRQIEKSYRTASERQKARSQFEQHRLLPDIESQIMYQTNLENRIRNIEQRARNQEQLLRFKRVNRSQKIDKKIAIDNAVVDTIKARLSMMTKTLDK